MKKFIFIKIALLFALICSFVFLSCSNDEETGTNQPEKGSPTAPNFSYGEYMYSQLSNVVFYLDSQRCLALKFKDIGNYKAFDVTSSECVNNVRNYVDYGLSGELVWHPTISDLSAYKLTIEGTKYYVYSGFLGAEIGTLGTDGSLSGTRLKSITDKSKFTLPVDGSYISISASSETATKLTINNESKYLYAVISGDGQSITFYLDDSDSITDFTSLTPYDSLTGLSYGFGLTSSTPYTEVTKDGWEIKYANSRLIVTKENVITSSVVLKKKE